MQARLLQLDARSSRAFLFLHILFVFFPRRPCSLILSLPELHQRTATTAHFPDNLSSSPRHIVYLTIDSTIMGWSWFSSSPSAPQTPPPAPTPLSKTEAPKAPNQAERDSKLQSMLLERQNLQSQIERLKRQEEAAHQTGKAQAQQTRPDAPPPSSLDQRAPQDQFRRGAKQAALFFAGAGFLAASVYISRRSVSRKMISSYPGFYQPSHHGPKAPPRGSKEKGDDQLVAVEALGLATLNVFSFGVMMTGGLMFAFDISNLEDLRAKARKNLYGTNGVVDEAAEQQVEEWIADVLSRRDKREEGAKGEHDSKNKSG